MTSEKDMFFGAQLEINDFFYLNEWLEEIMNHYNIKCLKILGETREVNESDVEFWIKNISSTLSSYNCEGIYNLNETGLFFELGPNKTLTTVPQVGVKRSKNRLRLLYAVMQLGLISLGPLLYINLKIHVVLKI